MNFTMPIAPDFPDGFTWFNTDRPLHLNEELKGQVVILDFWTYCCINCMHVLPDLEYLEEKYAADPVVIIGVHSNKYRNEAVPGNVRAALWRYGITHPVVLDDDHLIWGMYGVNAWPTLVVIDATGHVLGALPGEGHREELDRLIAGLLEIGRQQHLLAAAPLPKHPEQKHPSTTGLSFPGKVLVDPAGARLFIADSGHHRVIMTDWDGEVKGFFGSGVMGFRDGAYEDARFHNPQGMALFGGALYIADTGNHAIRRIDLASFHVDTVAGNGMIGYDRHGGHRGREQVMNSPWDLAYLDGALYIAMAGLHQIWSYDPVTNVSEVCVGTGRENITDNPARKAALAQPSGLAAGKDKLYFADSETSAIRVYDLKSSLVRTLVGKGLFTFGDEDGPREQALLQHPLGVAAAGDVLYVADSYNHKIRRIEVKSGEVSTVVGSGEAGRLHGEQLALFEPGGLSVAGHDLFIADTNNDRIIHYRLDTGAWREVVPKIGGLPLPLAA